MKIFRSAFTIAAWSVVSVATTMSLARDMEKTERHAPWLAFRVIDIHAHIGQFSGYDLSLENLLSELKKSGVQLALVSNIDGADIANTRKLDETQANEATAEVVTRYPSLLRGLAWARPEDGAAEKIDPFFRNYKDANHRSVFVGIKFHPEFNHYDADDKRVDPDLNLCAKYKVPAVFHCGSFGSKSGPEKIYAVARRHPNVPVILYHMGFGTDHNDAIHVAKEAIQWKDALLYLETAQADPSAVAKAIREIGPEHVLFGTDATYFGREHYGQYQQLIDALHAELTPDQFKLVVHDNAVRLFHLSAMELDSIRTK